MDREKLEKRLSVPPTIRLDEALGFIPQESHEAARKLLKIFKGNTRQLSYCILVSSLYDPQTEALEAISKSIPLNGSGTIFDQTLYQGLFQTYKKRVANGVPHNINLLLAETDETPTYRGHQGKIGPGLMNVPTASGRARNH